MCVGVSKSTVAHKEGYLLPWAHVWERLWSNGLYFTLGVAGIKSVERIITFFKKHFI